MKKVLFVNPASKPLTSANILIEPIDVLQMATFVESLGFSVQVLDMNLSKNSLEVFESKFVKYKFSYIVFLFDYHIPLHSDDSLEQIFDLVHISSRSGAKSIICGKMPTIYPDVFYKNGFDFVLKGDAENQLRSILLKEETNFCLTDLNEVPAPNRDFVDLDDYIDVRSVLSSRGCINRCSFCAVPNFTKFWRGRDSEKVLEEIEGLYRAGNNKILFLDDNFTVDKKRVLKICRGIKERKINACFGCLASINTVDFEMLKEMKDANFCWIHYGIESGSEDILKNISKNISIEKIRRVVNYSKRVGFRVRGSFIADLPGSTEEDLEKTLKFILELDLHEVRIHNLAIRCTSELAKSGSANSSQFIHSTRNKSKIISRKVDLLLRDLKRNDYLVVRDQAEWEGFEARNNVNFNSKLISLCPMKYGLGWRRNE